MPNTDQPPVQELDVIAVGAHPDDVEIGCGGVLASLVEQGYRVGIVDLTDGEPTPASPGPEVRLAEARQAAGILGVQERFLLDLPNRRLFDGFDERVALAKVFRRWRPKLVLGLGNRTPLASPDHWQAMQITDAAVFYSRLTKWDDQFDHLPPHTIPAQIYYTLNFHSLESAANGADFIVDISRTLKKKLSAIRAYETQFPPEKQAIFKKIEQMNRLHGETAGFAAGERLTSPRSVGVVNLMESLRL